MTMKSSTSDFFVVYSSSTEVAEPEATWDAYFQEKYRCVHGPDVPLERVVSYSGEDVPLHCDAYGTLVIRDDLLNELRSKAANLRFGNLLDESGHKIHGFQTIGGEHSFVVRGGKRSIRSFCPHCARLQYFPLGKIYVLQNQLPRNPVSLTSVGLVIDKELRDRLALQKWKKLKVLPLPVFDEPRDGLPADLTTVTPDNIGPVTNFLHPGLKKSQS